MKILITTDTYKPSVNGVVTSVLNLYEEMTKRGHDVRILTLSNDRESRKEDHVYYIGSFAVNIYPGARGSFVVNHPFLQELLNWKPDIVHTQSEFVTFSFAKRIAKKLHIPCIHTYHTMYEDYTHYFIKSKKAGKKCVSVLSRMLLKHCDAVIVPTNKVQLTLRDYGIRKDLIQVPTGIALTAFANKMTQEERQELRTLLHIKKEDKVLVTVGRLGKEKNIEQLLSLLKTMIPHRCGLKLLIVGDGPYKLELEREVFRLNLQNSVIFTGMVDPDKVAAYYQLGDIFVNASTSETQGLTYLEAMASGLPVVCRNDTCLEDVLVHGYNGFAFENQLEFFDYVTLLLEDDEKRQKMGNHGLNMSNKFSSQNFAYTLEKVYQDQIIDKQVIDKNWKIVIRRLIA